MIMDEKCQATASEAKIVALVCVRLFRLLMVFVGLIEHNKGAVADSYASATAP